MADDAENNPAPDDGVKAKASHEQGAGRQPEGPEASSKPMGTGPSAAAKDASAAKDAGATPKGEGPESAKADGPGTSGASASSEQKAGTAGKDGSSTERVFDVFENALKNADWAWKIKSGPERELGLSTFVNAQKAWVAAAVEDPKRASQMWRAKTKRNPTAEMEQMLSDRVKENVSNTDGQKAEKTGATGKNEEIDTLDKISNDIEETSKRRDLNDSKNRKISLSSTLGDWNVMRGDAQSRERAEKRKRTDELLSPEPDKNQDGLHLAKSLYKGFMTHRESAQGAIEASRRRMVNDVVGGIEKEIGKVSTKIKDFETELNVPEDERDTLGVVGRSLQRMESHRTFSLGTRVGKILVKQTKNAADKSVSLAGKVAGKAAMESRKKFGQVADASRKLVEGAAIQGAALTSTPGKIDGPASVASFQARMDQFNRFQRSNMGPGQ